MRVLADRLRRPHTTVQPGMGGGPSRAERFAVAPGHTANDIKPGVEVVVKEYEHFWIVEKRGEAGDVAAELE